MGKRTMWLAIGLAMVLGLVSLPELQAGRLDTRFADTKVTTRGTGYGHRPPGADDVMKIRPGAGGVTNPGGMLGTGGMTGTGPTGGMISNSTGELISLPVVEIPAEEKILMGSVGSLRGLGNVGFQAVVDGTRVTGHIRVTDDDQVRVYTTNEGHIYTAPISNFANDLSRNDNIDSITLGKVLDGNYITSNLNLSTGGFESPTTTPVAEVFSTHALTQDLALTNTRDHSMDESNAAIDFAQEAGLISNVNRGNLGIASGTMVISADTATGDRVQARQTLSGSSVTVNSLEVSSPEREGIPGIPRARVEWLETSNMPLTTALGRGVHFVGVTYQADGQNHYAVLERVEDPTGHSDYNIREIDHRPVEMTPKDQLSLIASFGGNSPTATATGIGWLEPGETQQDSIRTVNSWRDNNGNWHTISGDAGRRENPLYDAAVSGVLNTGINAISTGDNRNADDLGFTDGFIQAHQNIGIIDQSGNIDPERFQRYFGQLDPRETHDVINTFSLQDQEVFRTGGHPSLEE